MRSTYRGLAYLLAALVLVQAAAIAYALAGMGYWVYEEGGVVDKALIDSDDASFQGVGGFMVHGMNGMMVIPLVVLVLLVVSFFTKLPGATKNALILLGLVVVQVVLGIASHSLPYAIILHAINAFAIFSFAAMVGIRLRNAGAPETLSAPATASV